MTETIKEFDLANLTTNGVARRNIDQALAFIYQHSTQVNRAQPKLANTALELFRELEACRDQAQMQEKINNFHNWCLQSVIESEKLSKAEKDALLDVAFDNPATDSLLVRSGLAGTTAVIFSMLSLAVLSNFKIGVSEDDPKFGEKYFYNFVFGFGGIFMFSAALASGYLYRNYDSAIYDRITQNSSSFVMWLAAFAKVLQQHNPQVSLDISDTDEHIAIPVAQVINAEECLEPDQSSSLEINRIRQIRDYISSMLPSDSTSTLNKKNIDYLLSSAETRRQVDKIILFSDKHAVTRPIPKSNAARLFLDLKQNQDQADKKLEQLIDKCKLSVEHSPSLKQPQRDMILDIMLSNPGRYGLFKQWEANDVRLFKKWAAKMEQAINQIEAPAPKGYRPVRTAE